jgi:hypothetical protein
MHLILPSNNWFAKYFQFYPSFFFCFYPISQELGSVSEEVSELRKLLQNEIQLRKAAEDELNKLKSQFEQFMQPGVRIKLCIAFPLLTFTKPSIINPQLTKKRRIKLFIIYAQGIIFHALGWWRHRDCKASQDLGGWSL